MVKSILVDSTEEVEERALYNVIADREQVIAYTEETHGFDLSVKYKLPNLRQKNTAEMLYSKSYNKMLRDKDHMTIGELLETAISRGMWSEKESERLANLDGEILEERELVRNESVKKKKAKLEKKLAGLRDEKFRLAIRVGSITSTALENLAEYERTVYMLVNCVLVVDEDGKELPMYPTKQDIDDETNMKKLERILLEGKSFWTGEGLSDFLHLGD